MPGLFITSVGTGVGKTLVTAILCRQRTQSGHRVRALKPVVSGFRLDDPGSDPCLLLRSLGQEPSFEAISAIAPWRFETPISPHLAARREGRSLDFEDIVAFCRVAERAHPVVDDLLIEGAGGLMAPLDETHTVLDLIARLRYAAVVVTGSYLGAISHTLTALEVLHRRRVPVQAIVVSESEPSAGIDDTIDSIRQFAASAPPVYALPRLAGGDDQKWRAAPDVSGLCDLARQ